MVVLVLIMVVSILPTVRADTIDSYDISNANIYPITQFAENSVDGQCFRPSAQAQLNSAGLAIDNIGGAGGTWSFRIYSTTGTYGSTCDKSVLLAESADFTGSTISSTESMVTKSFTGVNQITLEANVAYAVTLILKSFSPSPCCSSGQSLALGEDTTSPTHAGNRIGDAATDIAFIVSGTSTVSSGIQTVCFGNCNTLANTNSTSSINFNVSQTIFYKQQISQDGFAINMSTVVGKSYAVSFGLTLFLGLYATDLSCPSLSTAFTPSCPAFLIRSEAFPNPQKGTTTMFLNNQLKAGQIVGIAFSANRDGLVLNDTTTNVSSFKTSGIMPTVITQFEENGNLKTNLKLNIEVAVPTPTLPSTTPTLGELLLQLIDNFAGGNRLSGGLFWFMTFSLGIILAVPIALSKYADTELPRGGFAMFAPFIFLGTAFMFTSLGALPAYVPILIFVIVAWLFAKQITER